VFDDIVVIVIGVLGAASLGGFVRGFEGASAGLIVGLALSIVADFLRARNRRK
jgi:hypothetical protein